MERSDSRRRQGLWHTLTYVDQWMEECGEQYQAAYARDPEAARTKRAGERFVEVNHRWRGLMRRVCELRDLPYPQAVPELRARLRGED